MGQSQPNLEAVVDEVERLVSGALAHVVVAGHAADGAARQEELKFVWYVIDQVRDIISLALEALGVTVWGERFLSAVPEGFKARMLDYDEDGEPYSPVLNSIQMWLNKIKAAYGIKSGTSARRALLRHLLGQTREIVALFDLVPGKEQDVKARVRDVVRLVFPDLTGAVVPRTFTTFKGDFGVPSLQTVVEFKYTATEGETKTFMGGLFEDMKGYSGSREWREFVAVVYIADEHANVPSLRAGWDAAHVDEGWDLVTVVGPGVRNPKQSRLRPGVDAQPSAAVLLPGTALGPGQEASAQEVLTGELSKDSEDPEQATS